MRHAAAGGAPLWILSLAQVPRSTSCTCFRLTYSMCYRVDLARIQDVSGVELGILGCHGHANGVQGYAPDRGASIDGLGDIIRHRHHDQMGD